MVLRFLGNRDRGSSLWSNLRRFWVSFNGGPVRGVRNEDLVKLADLKLEDEWQSYCDCCYSLDVKPNLKRFIRYNELYPLEKDWHNRTLLD
jgi:hypothetical protein